MSLKGYWPLDVNELDQHKKYVGGGVNGTLTYSNGFNTKAADFTGSQGIMIQTHAEAEVDKNFCSYSLWIRSTSTTGVSAARIIGRDASDYWCIALNQNVASGSQLLKFYFGSAVGADISTTIETDKWYHIAFGFDKTNNIAKFWLNGVRIFTRTAAYTWPITSRPVVIGQNTEDTFFAGNFFDGKIDEVRYYNHLLSDLEAYELSLGKIGHWTLDGTSNDNTLSRIMSSGTHESPTFVYDSPVRDQWVDFSPTTLEAFVYEVSDMDYWDFGTDSDHSFSVVFDWNADNTEFALGKGGIFRIQVGSQINFWLRAENAGVSSDCLSTTSGMTLGITRRVVCTYDGTDRKIYIDGILDKTCTTNYLIDSFPSYPQFTIGSGHDTSYAYDGRIGDVRLYGKALTQDDVTRLQNVRASMTDRGQLFSYKLIEKLSNESSSYGNKYVPIIGSRTVYGITDGTVVNKNGVIVGTVDRYGSLALNNAVGDLIESSNPISMHYNIQGMRLSWAGKVFSLYVSRYNPIELGVYALRDTEVRLYNLTVSKTVPESTYQLSAGEYSTALSLALINNYSVESDEPVCVYYSRVDGGDYHPCYPDTKELIGSSATGHVCTAYDNTEVTLYMGDGTSATYNLNRGDQVNLPNEGTRHVGVGHRLVANNPISCWSLGDGDGGDGVPYIAREAMHKEFAVTGNTCDYIQIIGLEQGATVAVYDLTGTNIYNGTVGNGSADSVYPTNLHILAASVTGGVINAGFRIVCSTPQYIIIQLSNDDETVLYGGYGTYGAYNTELPNKEGVINIFELDEVSATKNQINSDNSIETIEYNETL
jgi:hypothetical protein